MPMYVDGFVIPVPKKKVAAYRSLARKAAAPLRARRGTTRDS